MTEEEKNKKIKEYSERHRFWSNQVLTRFGYSINLFITIGIGFLWFLISNRDDFAELNFDKSASIDWNLTFYFSTILLVFSSVIIGSVSIISRLYDLRLTRHIVWTRKQTFKKLNKLLPGSYIDLKGESLLKTFFIILFRDILFIKDTEQEDYQQIRSKFEIIRKQSKVLGRLSWKTHKIQIILLVISVLIYSLTILK